MTKLELGAFALLGLLMVGAAPAAAAAPPNGSYLKSCMRVSYDGNTLAATCRSRDGTMTATTLPDARVCPAGVGNDDGQLRCDGYNPGGSYLNTCMAASSSSVSLTARCQRADGSWNDEAELDDPWPCNGSISNRDGELTCDLY
jgi:hypothetical protein